MLVNKTPAGTYRGPGRFGAAFVRERVMDMVAHKLGLDPAEVRLKNFIPTELDALQYRDDRLRQADNL